MNTTKHIAGLLYIGDFCDAMVNDGAPTPRYEFAPPAPGKPDINTEEGWNARAKKQNERNKARGLPYPVRCGDSWVIVDPRTT